jgi:ammonium transporter Rh
MITFGVAIGKVTPLQMLVLLVLEVPLYAANNFLVFEHYFVPMGATDAGGAMMIHFGLAATWRISISGATLVTFAVSIAFDGKLDLVHIQNSTLAGGVAMGAVPHLRLGPGAALLVGCFAGALSTCGYSKVSPWLEVHAGIRDTCGVNNLHGMPGILGGIVGVITLAGLNGLTAALGEFFGLLVTLAISIGGGLLCGEAVRHIDVYGSERDRINLAFEDSALMMTDPEKLAAP